MKGKHHFAHNSGMRGSEKAPEQDTTAAKDTPPADKPSAFNSGMRGNETAAAVDPQATAHDVSQGLQPGTNLEAISQATEPPTIVDGGDHYLVTHKVPKPKKV